MSIAAFIWCIGICIAVVAICIVKAATAKGRLEWELRSRASDGALLEVRLSSALALSIVAIVFVVLAAVALGILIESKS